MKEMERVLQEQEAAVSDQNANVMSFVIHT